MKDHRRSSVAAPAASGPVAAPSPTAGKFGNSYGLSIVECAEPGQDLSSAPYLIDCGLESEPLESSPRPLPRPASWMESSPRPVPRPEEGALASSLRPRPRPDGLGVEASGGAVETSPRPRARPEVDAAAAGDAEVVEHPMAGMLEVLPADYEGERLPHQVTREEYDATLALYDRIASGESNITLDKGMYGDMTEEEFQEAVMKDFAEILTTEQGRGLVGELAGSEDGVEHGITLGAAPEGESGWAFPVDDSAKDPASAEVHGSMLASAGIGTDAAVAYVPDTVQDLRYGSATEQEWAEFDSSTMLFHELVHAWEIHNGTYDVSRDAVVGDAAMGPYDADIPLEEYETIGLAGMGGTYTENGYREERAAVTGEDIPLRDSYRGSTPKERMAPSPG